MTRITEWTKKLGQQHWVKDGHSETLCGVPLLGNNYAKRLDESEKTPCTKCTDALHGNRENLSEQAAAQIKRFLAGGGEIKHYDDQNQLIAVEAKSGIRPV